jgi:DNA-binding NarL/FixJ family response regulator
MHVLVADGHTQVRWALRTAIKEAFDLVVIDEAYDAQSLLAKAQVLEPDLLLIEWELPGLAAGQALISDLHALTPGCRVAVLSRLPEARQAALAAGADLFVSKSAAPQQLLAALRTLMEPGAPAFA